MTEHPKAQEQPANTMHPERDYPLAIRAALDRYPGGDEYPYHNEHHGLDVMKAVSRLLKQVPTRIFSAHQKGLLSLAAAWHDAGYGDDPADYPEGIGEKEKERYAVHLFRQYAECELPELTDDDKDFIERAIMGTVVGPGADRTAPEAALLHMADVGHLLDASLTSDGRPAEKVCMSIRHWWQERVPHLSPKEFIELEEKFLPAEAMEIRRLAERLGCEQELIDEYGARVLGAMRAVRQVAEQEEYGN